MDPETLKASPLPPSPKRRRKALVITGLLILAWILVIVYRMELRSYYWAYRVSNATTEAERKPYLIRLASVDEHAVGALAGLIDDDDPTVRGDTIYLLGRLKDPRADELLLNALADESDANAWQAAVHLSRRTDHKRVYADLSKRFRSTSGREWEYTAITMGLSSIPGCISALIEETQQTEDPDRLAVLIDALRLARSAQATPTLQNLLDNDCPVTITPPSERHILKALNTLGPELQQKGIDVRTLTATPPPTRTVADLARRALEMIESPPGLSTTRP